MKIKQVVFSAKNRVEIQEKVLDQKLEPNQALIQTACSMVSPGTELAALTSTHSKSNLKNKPGWLDYPSVPGYLVCGKIIDKGKGVKHLKKGDRIVGEGAGVWNSHVSHLVMDAGDPKIVPIANNVTYEEAVTTKMGSIAMTGPRVVHPRFGDTVVVMGLGIVGQIAAQLSMLAGAGTVIGVDPILKRRQAAEKFKGIKAEPPGSKRLKTFVPGDRLSGFHHIIEASGHPAAFLQACEMARIRGKIAVLSSPHKSFEIRLYDHIHSKGLQVLGAHGFVLPFAPEVNDTWTDAAQRRFFMQLLSEKRVDVKPMITHRIKYDNAPEVYKGLTKAPAKYLGVIFLWNNYKGGKP
jgi:2-desacetyl-2-hydroxyethyl bacteriochlorophyllide A dehydrogenase